MTTLNTSKLPVEGKMLLDLYSQLYPDRIIFIGGGFVRDSLLGQPYKDVDLFIEIKDDEDELDADFLYLPLDRNGNYANLTVSSESSDPAYQVGENGLEAVYSTTRLLNSNRVLVNLCFHRKQEGYDDFVSSVVGSFDLDICQAYSMDGEYPAWTRSFSKAVEDKRVSPCKLPILGQTRERGRRFADKFGYILHEDLLTVKLEGIKLGPLYTSATSGGSWSTVIPLSSVVNLL